MVLVGLFGIIADSGFGDDSGSGDCSGSGSSDDDELLLFDTSLLDVLTLLGLNVVTASREAKVGRSTFVRLAGGGHAASIVFRSRFLVLLRRWVTLAESMICVFT